MKVSLNLAQDFSSVDLVSVSKDEIVKRIGAQLGAIESVKDWSSLYEGVVVVKVVSCIKHPNADKLSVCRIDDGGAIAHVERGDDGLVQVVCGAPNVAAGQYVAWIPPEVAVPSTREMDPFVMEARAIRGEISNGMLASPKELAISDEHDGILVIEPADAGKEPVPGEPLLSFFGLNDFVVDCENKMFTHRPDCFGNLGVARELAGILGERFTSPEWYAAPPIFETATTVDLKVANEIPELVPRFMAVVMQDVTVSKSPIWLQALLKRVGIKSINTVVDSTNYVMHLTGQPLHAFDYDKLQKLSNTPTLQPRKAKKGEKITLLGDKTIELTEEDMVIATDTTPVALAGVMGGADTEVDASTKTIVIECATFDMFAIRRTSMRHGLFTDAVTRFNKGQSPLQNDRVLAFAMKQLQELCGAVQASPVYDLASFDTTADNTNLVTTTASFVNSRLGSNLSADDMKTLLENVEFSVTVVDETLEITVPFWRMDISIEEDIVEEIGRLYGYENIPVVLPPRSTKPAPQNALRVFKSSLRSKLAKLGGNEVLTYSFVHGNLLQKVGIDPVKWTYHLRNAISPDLQYYRPSLLPSLLAKVHANTKAAAGSSDNAYLLFEIGKAHIKDEMDEVETTLPKEYQRLAGVYAADAKTHKKDKGAAYYIAKAYVDEVTEGQATYLPLDTNQYPITAPFAIGRSAIVSVNGEIVGVVGECSTVVRQALKLPEATAGFELDIPRLQEALKPRSYTALSPFPSVEQDITLEVANEVNYGSVFELLKAELHVIAAENDYLSSIAPVSLFTTDAGKNRFSFRVSVSDRRRTLTTTEVAKLMTMLGDAAHEKMQAVRI